MGIVALRADFGRENPAEDAVKRFFTDLEKGRLEAARQRTAEGFEWFGRAVTKADWKGEKLRTFVRSQRLRIGKVRLVSMSSIEAMPEYAVARAFGPLTKRDRVVLADITRAGTTTTALVVVSTVKRNEWVLRRVLDPAAFTRFVEFAAVLHHVEL